MLNKNEDLGDIDVIFMSPQLSWGDIGFGADPCQHPRCFYTLYLLSQAVDFD